MTLLVIAIVGGIGVASAVIASSPRHYDDFTASHQYSYCSLLTKTAARRMAPYKAMAIILRSLIIPSSIHYVGFAVV